MVRVVERGIVRGASGVSQGWVREESAEGSWIRRLKVSDLGEGGGSLGLVGEEEGRGVKGLVLGGS